MTTFTLVPRNPEDSNLNEFYIEMTYGELRPRMVTNVRNPSLWSRLLATTRGNDGYRNADQAIWRIEKVEL